MVFQGRSARWMRAIFASVGATLCIGMFGCNSPDKSKDPPKPASTTGLPGTPTLPPANSASPNSTTSAPRPGAATPGYPPGTMGSTSSQPYPPVNGTPGFQSSPSGTGTSGTSSSGSNPMGTSGSQLGGFSSGGGSSSSAPITPPSPPQFPGPNRNGVPGLSPPALQGVSNYQSPASASSSSGPSPESYGGLTPPVAPPLMPDK
jgi:hypothetical protein